MVSVVTVRNLDESTRERLKAQARSHGRSMESEVRAILTAAVTPEVPGSGPLGSRIAALFAGIEGDAVPTPRPLEPGRAAVFEA